MEKRVIGYVRYSPGGHSLETQIRHVQEKAEAIGGTLLTIYEEPGKTGRKSGARPCFDKKFLPAITPDLYGIVSPEMSRLTRNRMDELLLFDACRNNEVGIYLKRGVDIDLTTAAGRIAAELFASVARFEVDLKDERVEGAEQTRILNGKRRPAKRQFGYDPTGYVLDLKESAEIKAGVREVLKGEKWGKIAQRWNSKGLHTPRSVRKDNQGNEVGVGIGGNPWRSNTVQKFLTLPSLAGLIKAGDSYVKGDWPPIITEAEHHALVALVGGRAENRGRPAPSGSLLGGIARCGKCGSAVHATTNNRVPVYRCKSCHGVGLRRGKVDEYVESYYLSHMGWSPTGTDTEQMEREIASVREEASAMGKLLANKQITVPQLLEWNAANLPRIAELEEALSEAAQEDMTAWKDLSLDQRRKRLREWTLGPVELHPAGRGRRNWAPADLVVFLGE